MSTTESFDARLDAKRLVVCVGPGGVGKTTVAASRALRESKRGRKVLVLTIDPAKRLAQALGIEGLGDAIKKVELGEIEAQGELHAAMFDQATAMDALMERVSPDAATRQGILQNRVYRAMAGSLARSHAYLAMERLHQVMNEGGYDLVVLDTPPARNALDILDAPGTLARFLDENVIKWFVQKERKGLAGRLLSGGGAAVTKLFGMVVGQKLLDETLAFFNVFYELRSGFRERAEAVQEIMRARDCAFVLVSAVDPSHLDDARALARSVVGRGVEIDFAYFNRAYERLDVDDHRVVTELPAALESEAADFLEAAGDDPSARAALDALLTHLRLLADKNQAAEEAVASLAGDLAPRCVRRLLPAADHDIRDLAGLAELAAHLAE